MLTVLFLVEKKIKAISAFSHVWKICILKEACNGSNFVWLIRQKSVNQKSGQQTFHRRPVSGSFFISPCTTECYLQSETKIEPVNRNRAPQRAACWKCPFSFFLFCFLTSVMTMVHNCKTVLKYVMEDSSSIKNIQVFWFLQSLLCCLPFDWRSSHWFSDTYIHTYVRTYIHTYIHTYCYAGNLLEDG